MIFKFKTLLGITVMHPFHALRIKVDECLRQ
jgi:hypothetical protein